MMVSDDDINPTKLSVRDALKSDRTYIYCNNQGHTPFFQFINCRGMEAIPFAITMRNVIFDISIAYFCEEIVGNHSSWYAVTVKVRVNSNALTGIHRVKYTRSRLAYVV